MTGLKLLCILALFLLAGYIEANAQQVPVLREWNKVRYNHIESTYAGLLGMSTMPSASITYEDSDD